MAEEISLNEFHWISQWYIPLDDRRIEID
jgi:hypothetical protein